MPPAAGWSLAHLTNPYDLYSLTITYHWSSGDIAVPVAYSQGVPSDQTVKIVNLSKAQGRKRVVFEMRRQGAPCQVLDPLAVSANEKLLSADVVLKDPEIDASGQQYLYHAKGEYVYALLSPIFVNQTQYPLGATDAGQRQGVGDLATGGIDS